jgi:hypothetical protein
VIQGAQRSPLLLAALALIIGACVQPNNVAATRTWESEGVVHVMDGQTWVVGDRLLTIAPGAEIPEPPVLGARVRVSVGRTDRGKLLAQRVQVVDNPAAQATVATTSATPSEHPTPTPPARVDVKAAVKAKAPLVVKPASGREQDERPKPRDHKQEHDEEDEDDEDDD